MQNVTWVPNILGQTLWIWRQKYTLFYKMHFDVYNLGGVSNESLDDADTLTYV